MQSCKNKPTGGSKFTGSASIQTNPRYSTFHQAIFTAGDRDQFDTTRKRSSIISADISSVPNMFRNDTLVRDWIKYRDIDSRAVADTFSYIFEKFKKGIFVKIENNKLVNLLPFSNVRYENEFSHQIHIDPKFKSTKSFVDYVTVLSGYKRPDKIKPVTEWVANNSMFRFEVSSIEKDHNTLILRDMLATLCANRTVPDTEFFLNRRDFPILKRDGTEPYFHIYDHLFYPLLSHLYDKYAPVFSASSNNLFADIMYPTYEDWARAKFQYDGTTFPDKCKEYPRIIDIPWVAKKPIAVFRGATTGAGTRPDNNQRLRAFEIGEENKHILDVGFTSWNLRIRKYQNEKYLQTIERETYPVTNTLTLQEQAKYKYILHLEGHVAAFRLSYELSSGSVILLAQSNWSTWYRKLLEPFVHYVPVNQSLDNLIEMIEWCKLNDEACQRISENAKDFYTTYLGIEGILDYLQEELIQLMKIVGPYDYLPNLIDWTIDCERAELSNESVSFSEKFNPDTVYPYTLFPNPRCIGRLNGTMRVFRATPEPKMKFVKSVFKNKNGNIDLYTINGFFVVRKSTDLSDKQKEHDHEAYIGQKAVNLLVSKVPNFAYVYGHAKGSSSNVFIEHIPGVPFSDWLGSSSFNINDYLTILVQLALALIVAQRYVAFVHNDLFPWNIIIQQVRDPIEFHYDMVPGELQVNMKTKIIPIIIDYGKSRAVVFEEEYGLIDHTSFDFGHASQIIDALSILISSVNIIRNKINTETVDKLLGFAKTIWPNYVSSDTLLDRFSKFGSIPKLSHLFDPNITPVDFIEYLASEFKPVFSTMFPLDKSTFSFKMERGNAIQTETEMLTGNQQQAMLKVITHIDKSTRPTSRDKFFQLMQKNLLHRYLRSFIEDIDKIGDSFVKFKWEKVKKIFDDPQPKIETEKPENVYPLPELILLDLDITPQFVRENYPMATHVADNWEKIWSLFYEMGIFYPDLTLPDYVYFNSFKYFTAIASNNTLIKINRLFLISSEN